MSEAGRVGGRDGPRGTAGYVGSLVARAIEGSRGKGMRLVLSSYHGRRCISIRVIAAGTFFFSMVHVCLWVRRRRRYLFSCCCRWCFSYFGAAGFLFIRSVVAAGFHILAAGVFFVLKSQVEYLFAFCAAGPLYRCSWRF